MFTKRKALIATAMIVALVAAVVWQLKSSSLFRDDLSVAAAPVGGGRVIASPQAAIGEINTGRSTAPASTARAVEQHALENKVSSVAASGLVRAKLRVLLNSDQLMKVDYAWRRLEARCTNALKDAADRPKAFARLKSTMAAFQRAPQEVDRIYLGNASFQQRVAAFDKLHALCDASLEGAPLSAADDERFRASSQFIRFRDIALSFPMRVMSDPSDPEMKAKLTTVVTSPMYATLEQILATQLDLAPLKTAYPEELVQSMSVFLSQIMVCRMGEDCGLDGLMTLRLCQDSAICGNDFEGAVWDHLQSKGIDTRAFREFVDQRQRALAVLDFSILRGAKPKK